MLRLQLKQTCKRKSFVERFDHCIQVEYHEYNYKEVIFTLNAQILGIDKINNP